MNRKQKFKKTAINLSAVILMSSALVLQSSSGETPRRAKLNTWAAMGIVNNFA
ncbi:hypothetical protein [Brevibacillus choshinensis]|uniref:hypothetical protein n=1 Tax=Brevibacillus choshinensis TaxID=54911 RepID=UPI000A500294|nr:hypothetical protein [Brevibacillus choshinensis]